MLNQFILLGPPGSGKGTQAKVLADKLKVPHISTGDIFRDHITRQTELGKQVDSILQQGSLVTDDITNKIVADRLQQADAASGFVFDGYPRNLVQAEFLYRLYPQVRAINLAVPDDELVKRIASRRTCAKCGAIYNLIFKAPRQVGICDLDGGELQQRADEVESTVRDRLVVYHKQTEPLINYYQTKGTLINIDGQPPIAEVTVGINQALGL